MIMIARIWKALADADKVKDYVSHFERNVHPELAEIAGFKGAHVMQKQLADGVEIQVMTLWESMVVISEFAGEDVTRAVVEPEAIAALRSYDKAVSHYEVLVSH
jgi:heme-degrading monooxygenase HmoA